MGDEWRAAVEGGDADKLSELVLSSAGSKADAALSILRSCVAIIEKKEGNPAVGEAKSDAITANGNSGGSDVALLTLENVQLLQPRGRFDLVFRRGGVTVSGKAGTVAVSWSNVRHIIRLPRPEGFNWGKSLDPNDPAGSDLVAIPLNAPVPFRKSMTSLVLLQPDPKAKHSEVTLSLDGTSHQVSGSQGTVVLSALQLLSGARPALPDRGLFASRDGKSFVKCHHGVNEGALFPLKQGLLFMKPALFLPTDDIEQVVCGRGGSATTRYVDLVVGLETEAEEGDSKEFSNIDRDALPSLQSYIQDALVAPRQREAKRAAKLEAAAAAAATEQQQQQPRQDAAGTGATPATAATTAVTAEAAAGVSTLSSSSAPPPAAGAGRSAGPVGGAVGGALAKEAEEEEDVEEDDDDAESDEDFAPAPGDTDSGDDSGSSGSSGDDNDGDDNDDDDDEDDADYGDDGGGGGGDGESDDGSDDSAAAAAAAATAARLRAEALRELDELANEAAGGGGSGSGGGSGGGGSGGGGGGGGSGSGSGMGRAGKGKGKRKVGEVAGGGAAGGVLAEGDDEGTESEGEREGAGARKRRR